MSLPNLEKTRNLPPPLPTNTPPFYVVSLKKFWLLFMFTFTLYIVYWSYKQWKTWKIATGEKVSPVGRTFIWVAYIFVLIRKIFDRAKLIDETLNIRTLEKAAGIAVAAACFNRVFDRLTREWDITFTYIGITLIFFFVTGWGIAKIQHYANMACHDPQGTQNSKLTWANYIWLIIGGLLWLVGFVSAGAPFLGITIE